MRRRSIELCFHANTLGDWTKCHSIRPAKRQAAVDDITPDNKTTEENYQRVLSDVEQK